MGTGIFDFDDNRLVSALARRDEDRLSCVFGIIDLRPLSTEDLNRAFFMLINLGF